MAFKYYSPFKYKHGCWRKTGLKFTLRTGHDESWAPWYLERKEAMNGQGHMRIQEQAWKNSLATRGQPDWVPKEEH